MRKLLMLAYLATGHLTVNAQYIADSTFIKSIADNILVSNTAHEYLYHLTKHIGGRLAGSPQAAAAERWGLQVFKALNADTAYWQPCMVPHWVRGGKDSAVLVYRDNFDITRTQVLNCLALGNTIGTGKQGVKARIIRINHFDELETYKAQIKGNVVFYNAPFEQTFIETFKAYGKNATYRSTGPSKAARYGAVAVMVRSMTHAYDNHAHTGATVYNDSFPKIPAVAIGLKDVTLLNQLFDGKHQQPFVHLFTNGQMLPDTIGNNVIAELRGTEFPNEIITIGGHLDSWDVAEGAHDDGTGIVQTIEVLRVFKALGYQPKRTIRFVLFANEENGTRGAKAYANAAKQRNEKHVFALESDAGGFTPRGFGITASNEVFEKIKNWASLLAPYYGNNIEHGGGGADIAPLNRTFNTPIAGLQPDSQRYFDLHHAVTDVFEAVNIREMQLGAVNMAALIYLVDKYGL
ncbi:MAG: M20/M25/M40 family metallo-hydrolase [Chitinophagaceae bacterium]